MRTNCTDKMSAMHYLSALAAFAASLACLWILLSPLGRRLMLDHPNARSLHEQPVPRSGGLAIIAGAAAGIAGGTAAGAAPGPFGLIVALGLAAALAALSLADDLFTLPTLLRLAAHLAAAGAAVSLLIGVSEPLHFVLLALAVAWYANLYNFMDGSDGLAGGMTVMMDGGIRRGTDVLKALALGAQFVFVGRPFLYAAAIAGEAGVRHGIRLLSEEIERDMALLGITTLAQMTRERIRPRQSG
mgnify:CR=1 FL=1